jgi:hypothetical protein
VFEDGRCVACDDPLPRKLERAVREINGYLNEPRVDFLNEAKEILRIQYGS